MGAGGNVVGRIPPVTAPAGRKPVLPHPDTVPAGGRWDELNRAAGNDTATQNYLGRNNEAEEAMQAYLSKLPREDVDRFILGMYAPGGSVNATQARSLESLKTTGGRPLLDPNDSGTQEAAWKLYRQMRPNAFAPFTQDPGGDKSHFGLFQPDGLAGSEMLDGPGQYKQPAARLFVSGQNGLTGMVALHESGHYGQKNPTTFSESVVPAAISNPAPLSNSPLSGLNNRPLYSRAELAPTLESFPAIAELAKMRSKDLGVAVPPVNVQFANGSGMDLEAMRQAAQSHGLLNSQKSIQELLNTQAGQAWLKQKILPQPAAR